MSEYTTHIKVGEQNIDNETFDDILLKGKLQYPALRLRTEGKMGLHAFNGIKNSIKLTEGSHYFYVVIDGNTHCIGKINVNISNIYRLETLIRRLKPSIEVCANVDDEFKQIKSTDLMQTLELDI